MGWGRTFLLGDIGNRLDIDDVEQDIRDLRRDLEAKFRGDMSQDDVIKTLVQENAELRLYLASLIRLLTLKRTISPEELTRMVTSIDAEDGTADGKYDGDIV